MARSVDCDNPHLNPLECIGLVKIHEFGQNTYVRREKIELRTVFLGLPDRRSTIKYHRNCKERKERIFEKFYCFVVS